jgi:hypothetical protein
MENIKTEVSGVEVTTKKVKYLPKGFFTVNGEPTRNAVICYVIFFENGGNYHTDVDIPQETIQKIKDFFGWKEDTGFSTQLAWGLRHECGNSKTSQKVHKAMRKALFSAWSLYRDTAPTKLMSFH